MQSSFFVGVNVHAVAFILLTNLTQFFIGFFWVNMVKGTSPSSDKIPIFVVCY